MLATAKPLLIVDDDLGLLRQLRWAFSDHRVYPAGARQEAIDLVRKEAIPVAIVGQPEEKPIVGGPQLP